MPESQSTFLLSLVSFFRKKNRNRAFFEKPELSLNFANATEDCTGSFAVVTGLLLPHPNCKNHGNGQTTIQEVQVSTGKFLLELQKIFATSSDRTCSAVNRKFDRKLSFQISTLTIASCVKGKALPKVEKQIKVNHGVSKQKTEAEEARMTRSGRRVGPAGVLAGSA